MSSTEHFKGKLEKVAEKTDVEEWCKNELGSDVLEYYYDTYLEKLLDESYNDFVFINNVLYKVVNLQEIDPDFDILIFNKETNEFEVRFYNGVMSLTDAIEEAMTKNG